MRRIPTDDRCPYRQACGRIENLWTVKGYPLFVMLDVLAKRPPRRLESGAPYSSILAITRRKAVIRVMANLLMVRRIYKDR